MTLDLIYIGLIILFFIILLAWMIGMERLS